MTSDLNHPKDYDSEKLENLDKLCGLASTLDTVDLQITGIACTCFKFTPKRDSRYNLDKLEQWVEEQVQLLPIPTSTIPHYGFGRLLVLAYVKIATVTQTRHVQLSMMQKTDFLTSLIQSIAFDLGMASNEDFAAFIKQVGYVGLTRTVGTAVVDQVANQIPILGDNELLGNFMGVSFPDSVLRVGFAAVLWFLERKKDVDRVFSAPVDRMLF
jgi:hypothetical protein